MTTCPRCAFANEDGSAFCGSCGEALAAAPVIVTPPPTVAATVAADTIRATGSTSTSGFRPVGGGTTSTGLGSATTSAGPGGASRQTPSAPRPAPSRPAVSPAPAAVASATGSLLGDIAGIPLAHNEVVKRCFDLAAESRPLGSLEGRLVVTDSRILYQAKAKNIFNSSLTKREVQIADVSGFAMSTRRGVSPFGLVVAGVLGLLAVLCMLLAMLSGGSTLSLIVFLFFAFTAGFVLWISRVTSVMLVVFARQVEASPITFSSLQGGGGVNAGTLMLAMVGAPIFLKLLQRLGVLDAAEAAEAISLEDCEAMYDELGALVLDLQSRGVYGAS